VLGLLNESSTVVVSIIEKKEKVVVASSTLEDLIKLYVVLTVMLSS
jgi:hypothetical protein